MKSLKIALTEETVYGITKCGSTGRGWGGELALEHTSVAVASVVCLV